jgi:hypothetical protein
MRTPGRLTPWSTPPSGSGASGDARAGAGEANGHDLGRELFAGMRKNVVSAEEGACTWL